MLNPPPVPLGTYGVLTCEKEKLFVAPKSAKGRYDLYAHADGRFEYVPVKNKQKQC